MSESNEAGGAHYGNGVTPWDLQRDMQTWGSVFIDARRTDAIEYLFRTKGDRSKQLDDARKAKHNCEVIIAELEKETIGEGAFEIQPNANSPVTINWTKLKELDQIPPTNKLFVVHATHNWNGQEHCLNCGKTKELLALPCTNQDEEKPKRHVGDNLGRKFHPSHHVQNGSCSKCNFTSIERLKELCPNHHKTPSQQAADDLRKALE